MINAKTSLFGTATGTVDAIVVSCSPVPVTLTDGIFFVFRSLGENTLTNPTLNANGTGAKTIVKHGNQALTAGDIGVLGFYCIVSYNETIDKYELLNPKSSGISVSTLQNAYDNSTTPEILTDSTRGAVTLKRGSAADTDDVLEIENNAGVQKFAVTGNGKIFTASETASRIASINSGQEIESLNTATYPDLTELSYLKGVTSSIQDQIDSLGNYVFMTGGDQSTTSASATAITDLVTPTLDANSRYIVYAYIHIGCNNTGGVNFAFDIPTASSIYVSVHGRSTSNGAYRQIPMTADATLTGLTWNALNNANGGVILGGEIATGANSGTAQLMFSAGVAGQTATIYQEGTFLFIKKIV